LKLYKIIKIYKTL